jgi:sugar O-acyltransferase (sialic acid O-acetyltransferase NeuD family)
MPTDTRIILYGAGGHGKVVLDAVILGGIGSENLLVLDDNNNLSGHKLLDCFIHPISSIKDLINFSFHISIGDNSIRFRVYNNMSRKGAELLTIIHPNASISKFANIGPGSFLGASTVIAPNASIGNCVIVNHGAVVDHDCFVGDFSHIATNVCLCGGVKVGSRVLVGAGSVILPGLVIGDGAVIGAGSVVTSDILPLSVVAGVPAKPIKKGSALE